MSNVSLLQQLCELGVGTRGFEFISDNAEHTAPADMVFTAFNKLVRRNY
ncbi:MAG: hypothetical protein GX213_07455 [Clostridiaceae bacterium]|nr:hypothetical protein [Clostridiaceae bacterium]